MYNVYMWHNLNFKNWSSNSSRILCYLHFGRCSDHNNTQFAIYALGQVRSFHEQILLKIFCVKISLKNNHFCRSTITFIVNKQLFNLIFILIFIFYLYLLFYFFFYLFFILFHLSYFFLVFNLFSFLSSFLSSSFSSIFFHSSCGSRKSFARTKDKKSFKKKNFYFYFYFLFLFLFLEFVFFFVWGSWTLKIEI